jgi:hypothetical protein
LDVVLIGLHELVDAFAAQSGVGTGVFDGTAQSNVVTDEVVSARLGAQLIDVRLLDLVVT